jgi:hypothetical protein
MESRRKLHKKLSRKSNTYAHAYFDAFRLPVKSGDSSARSLMSVLTLSASPVELKRKRERTVSHCSLGQVLRYRVIAKIRVSYLSSGASVWQSSQKPLKFIYSVDVTREETLNSLKCMLVKHAPK